MKRVPFAIIQAAQSGDTEAINYIFQHFEGYIASHSQVYDEGEGRSHVDEELRYLATAALSTAIFQFKLRDPPEKFIYS